MDGNSGSPGGDSMDWNNDTPPHVYHQSSAPFNSRTSPNKRPFDAFADGTEPLDRTEVPASSQNPLSNGQTTAFQAGRTSAQNLYIPSHGWDTAFQRVENTAQNHYIPNHPSDSPWQGTQNPIQAQGYIPFQGNDPQYAQQANDQNAEQQTTRWNVPVPVQLAILGTYYLARYTSILAVYTCRAGWQDVRIVGRMIRRRPRVQETVTALAEFVGTTKRRIVSFTHIIPTRNPAPVYRQRNSTSPGRASTSNTTPPRFRPRPHTMAAEEDERRFFEEHMQTPAINTQLPENFEPLMSGALQDQDTEMGGIRPITPPPAICHSPRSLTLRTIPGTYPESPLAYKSAQSFIMPSTVDMANAEHTRPVISSSTRDEVDEYDTEDAGSVTPENVDESGSKESDLMNSDDMNEFNWDADSDYDIEPLPEVYPVPSVSDKIERGVFSELQIESFKDLLAMDEARIQQFAKVSPLSQESNEPKASAEATPSQAASHPTPPASEAMHVVQTEKPTLHTVSPAGQELIESNRSPLPAAPTTPGPHGTIGSIESPLSDISTPELPSRELSTPGLVPPITPIQHGSIESTSSPLSSLPTLSPPSPASCGLIDSNRSPLPDATDLLQDEIGLIESNRSPMSPGIVARQADVDGTETSSSSTSASSVASNGWIESNRSPLPDVTHLRQDHVGSMDLYPSPMLPGVAITRQDDDDWAESSPPPSPLAGKGSHTAHMSRPLSLATPSRPKRRSALAITTPARPSPSKISKFLRFFTYRKKTSSPLGQSIGVANPKTPVKAIKKSVEFYESPKTGRPVTGVKRFVMGESMSHPSPMSSHDESTLASLSMISDTDVDEHCQDSHAMREQAALDAQLLGCLNSPIGGNDSIDKHCQDSSALREQAALDAQLLGCLYNPVGGSDNIDEPCQDSSAIHDQDALDAQILGCQDSPMGGGDNTDEPCQDSSAIHDQAALDAQILGCQDSQMGGGNNIDEPCQDSSTIHDQAALDAQILGCQDSPMGGSDNPIIIRSDEQSELSSESIIESRDLTSPANSTPAADIISLADEHNPNLNAMNGGFGTQPSDSDRNGASSPKITDETSSDLTKKATKEGDDDVSVHTTPQKAAAPSPKTPAPTLVTKFADLSVSSRRRSLRRLRLEEEVERDRIAREKLVAKEKAQREKEEAEFQAQQEREAEEERLRQDREAEEERIRQEREAEEERIRLGVRRLPKDKIIQPLNEEWEGKVYEAMHKGMGVQLAMTSTGNPITRRDFGKVLPQPGTGDDMAGWLNDEIIAAYLQAVVDYGHTELGHKRGDTPKLHAFNTFFYTNLKKQGGYENVRRWARRAKIGGKDLERVEWVFIPVNVAGNHWTLAVVSPIRKTIEYFDSLHGAAAPVVANIKDWLKGELGSAYKPDEWRVIEDEEHYPGLGKGPSQDNAKDCGVFTVTTAKMITLRVSPMAVSAADMPLQRKRIVAELMNGGFSGEFEPLVEFV